MCLRLGYRATHNYKEAQAALAVPVADSADSEFKVAEIYAFLGEKNKCFEWLERARTLHDPGWKAACSGNSRQLHSGRKLCWQLYNEKLKEANGTV